VHGVSSDIGCLCQELRTLKILQLFIQFLVIFLSNLKCVECRKLVFSKFEICIFLSILPPLGLLPGVIILLAPSPSYAYCANHENTVVCQ
jgi:hypothetical protein